MFGPRIPVDAAKDAESFRRGGFEVIEVQIHERLTPPAVQIDIHADVGSVEGVDQFVNGPLIPATTKRRGEVVVRVDHREARLIDAGFVDCQPWDRLEIVKKYVLLWCIISHCLSPSENLSNLAKHQSTLGPAAVPSAVPHYLE